MSNNFRYIVSATSESVASKFSFSSLSGNPLFLRT